MGRVAHAHVGKRGACEDKAGWGGENGMDCSPVSFGGWGRQDSAIGEGDLRQTGVGSELQLLGEGGKI